MRGPPAAALIAAACMLALCACGSKAREPQVHRVVIRSMVFAPAELEVSVGDIVVWTNEDIVPHTVTAVGGFDSQSMTNKQEWRYTATKAGEYAYGCTFHPTMKGTLTVR
jgi:plastocyanin